MRMRIDDKKELARSYFEHENLIKDKMRAEDMHSRKKIRDIISNDIRLENRIRQQDIHEEERVINLIARQKEIDQHLLFLKLTSSLNII